MFVMVAVDWTMIGAALFLSTMDYITAPGQGSKL
jgi:hypothetical protein